MGPIPSVDRCPVTVEECVIPERRSMGVKRAADTRSFAASGPLARLNPQMTRGKWATAIVAGAIVCLGLGWGAFLSIRAHRKAMVFAAIAELGGVVTYDWEVDSDGLYLLEAEPPKTTLIDVLLGRKPDFGRVWRVSFEEPGRVRDRDLVCLRGFRQLRALGLEGALVTDRGIEFLGNFEKLQFVSLRGTLISDHGVSHLLQLKNLKRVDLGDTKVTQRGVATLVKRGIVTYSPEPRQGIPGTQ